MNAVIAVLLKHVKHEHRETRMAILNWIRHLHKNVPAKVCSHCQTSLLNSKHLREQVVGFINVYCRISGQIWSRLMC